MDLAFSSRTRESRRRPLVRGRSHLYRNQNARFPRQTGDARPERDLKPALSLYEPRNAWLQTAGFPIAIFLLRFSGMWQSYIFGMHWKHQGKMYYDELSAESQGEAAGYFIDHCRDDVSLVRVELVGPDESGVREYAHSPLSPFDPLRARRRLDKDEDAR